ncbi:MAG: hypothetical protein QG602_3700, partial [Verrucomicrobiota bacterium]|nr:hypothetical protein [Verrucomicrobiota bacterium]
GLNKNPADRGQEPVIDVLRTEGDASLGQWVAQKSNGELGTAVIAAPGVFAGYAEDDRNLLLLAKAVPGQPLVYFAGAGWSRAGEFTGKQAWSDYIAACAARLRAPVKVTLAP